MQDNDTIQVQSVRVGTGKVLEYDPEELRRQCLDLPSYILLSQRPGEEWFRGYTENSWSLSYDSKDRTYLFQTGTFYGPLGHRHDIDGKEWAEEVRDDYLNDNPDHRAFIFDAFDEKLPVKLDYHRYDRYVRDSRPSDTLSGVINKYGARNIKFSPILPENAVLVTSGEVVDG